MMQIFNFFGSIFGYLLWFLYTIFQNYGVAIILFTIIVKALVFPFSIKSQKSMAAQSRLAAKQKELAKEFLKFLYSDEVIALNAQLAKGIPPIKGAASLLEGVVSDAVLRSYDVFEDGYLPYITSYAMLPSGELVPRNAIYDRVGSVLDGTLRVEDWVAELEEIGTMLRQEEA